MSDPSLALQKAVIDALKDDGAVTALIARRVYDSIPSDAERIAKTGDAFPYVSFGPDQEIGDHAECLEGSVEISAQIDVWSRKPGKVEAKTISGAIVRVLNMADLSLDGYRLVLLEHESSRHLDDPDGLTSHSVLTFKALIDEV